MRYDVGPLRLELGVDWSIASSRREALESEDGEPIRFYFHRTSEEGLLFGVPQDPSARLTKSVPGAMAVGAVVPDAVVVEEVDDALIWVCAISNGLPLPGMDRVCPSEEAKQVLSEAMSIKPGCTIIGSIREAERTLDEVIEQIPRRMASKMRFTRTGINYQRVALIATIAVLTGGGWLGAQQYLEYRRTLEVREQGMLDKLLRQREIAEQRARLEREFEARIERSRRDLEAPVGAMEQGMQWFSLLTSLPVAQGVQGYLPEEIECHPGSCIVRWKGMPWANPLRIDDLPGRFVGDRATLASSQEKVSTEFQLKPLLSLTPDERRITNKIDDASDFIVRMRLATRDLGLKIDAKTPTPVHIAPPPELERTAVTVGLRGPLSAQADSLPYFFETLRVLNAWPVSLARMRATSLTTGPRYELEAHYGVIN